MTESKSIWNFLKKIFSRPKKNIKDLIILNSHLESFKSQDISENDSDLDSIINSAKPTSIKRHQTCSFDLSDKTMHLINTEQLINNDSLSNIYRTSSFNIDRDFPKKLLPITDFEEREVLGEGAFGRAIKVVHLKSGRFFVLKEVLSHSSENEESLIHEVSLMRSLKHNNVLITLGLVLKDKRICLLTELMHGGSLQAKILNFKDKINLNQKLLFLRDITAGMNFLHQHSIMHRDLTSTNCLLRKNYTVVVADFGLSKLLYDDIDGFKSSNYLRSLSTETINKSQKEHSETLTVPLKPKIRNFLSVGDISDLNLKEGNSSDDFSFDKPKTMRRKNRKIRRKHTVVGNPFWMAPEMLAGKHYNFNIDVYSFGIIGCEVTARVSAHPDTLERINKDMSINFKSFLQKHKEKELLTCPDDFIEIIGKCCDPNPDNRPNFNTLLSWIEDILFRVTNHIPLKMRTYSSTDSD